MSKLVRIGNSYYLLLPVEYISHLGIDPSSWNYRRYLDGDKIVFCEDFCCRK